MSAGESHSVQRKNAEPWWKAEFRGITGQELPPRQPNRLAMQSGRQPGVGSLLEPLVFDHPELGKPLRSLARRWSAECPCAESWELLGCVSYLGEEWAEAAQAYLHSLDLDADNVDAWASLAFALRHLGIGVGDTILFNLELILTIMEERHIPLDGLAALHKLAGALATDARAQAPAIAATVRRDVVGKNSA